MSILVLFLVIRDLKKMISISFYKNYKFYLIIFCMLISLLGAIIVDIVLINGIIKFI